VGNDDEDDSMRNGREKNDTVSRMGWMGPCCAVASSRELALA
jgi:hypothetical protein